MIVLTCIKQHLSKFEAQSMKKLSNTEAKLKKTRSYKKAFILIVHIVQIPL